MPTERETLKAIADLADVDGDGDWVHPGPRSIYERVASIHGLARGALDTPLQLPLDPPGDEARARRGDPQTSRAAAESLGDLRPKQLAVLDCLARFGPLTDEELVARYQAERASQWPLQSESGIRTRRHELALAHHVVVVGTASLRSGRQGRTWDAVTRTPRRVDG
jgi:hypothetical protein